MRIMQFYGGMKINYNSQQLHALYDSSYPDNPLWYAGSIREILNIKENRLISHYLPKKYQRTIVGISKDQRLASFYCVTTEGLIYLIKKRAKKLNIEDFLNWLNFSAIPEIKQKGDNIVNDLIKEITEKERVITLEINGVTLETNKTVAENNSNITSVIPQEILIDIPIEEAQLIQENLYLKLQLQDYIERLNKAGRRFDEVLKMNRQLSELLNKLVK